MCNKTLTSITFILMLLSTGIAADPGTDLTSSAEESFKSSVEKAKKVLTERFETAINQATAKGAIADVRKLQSERDAFAKDDTELPYHHSMLPHRMRYESSWWEAKIARDKALKALVVKLTKEKKFEEAESVQTIATEAAKLTFIPHDVEADLPGAWHVTFLGTTKTGPTIDYKTTWEFEKGGVVKCPQAKISGKWIYDYKARQIVVLWDNVEKAQEAFPLPITPGVIVGKTWHGAGVKFTVEKAIPK